MKRFISPKYYRLFFNFTAIILLFPLVGLFTKINSQFLFTNELLAILGAIILIIGLLVIVIALRQYDLPEFVGTQQLKENLRAEKSILKTDGMNRWVRHPLYFGTLLVIWGLFLFRPTDFILSMSTIATLYLYIGTKMEEQKLIVEFGNVYVQYKKEVPMFLPLKF